MSCLTNFRFIQTARDILSNPTETTKVEVIVAGGTDGGDLIEFSVDGTVVGSVEMLATGQAKWTLDGILDPIILRPTPQTTAELNLLIPIAVTGDLAYDSDLGYWVEFNGAAWVRQEANDLTQNVTWANVPDANITQSSVTQHETALTITESQISDLGTYEPADPTILKDADIGVTVQAHDAVLDATTASFTIADETKLDGIEDGADVTDAINVDAAGAVMNTDASTASMAFVIDDDTMATASDTTVPTSESVKAYVDSNVSSAKSYKGGYDAATNTPDLDTSPIAGIEIGDQYTVTDAGTFFTAAVQIGDVLIAEQDSPTLESHWTIVQANLDAASIKVQYESNANTNEFNDTEKADLALNTTHRTSDGSDHSFIDQDVTSGSAPTFLGTNITAIPNGNLAVDPLARANHTGVQTAATISDFDTEVGNHPDVTANTAKVGVTTEISNVVEDTTPQLGGNLDLQTFNIEGADAADLTKLSNVTASAVELNHSVGVTSAIQTQLDGKSATGHTHVAADITDFDTEVSNNASVTANTAKVSYTDAAAVGANTTHRTSDGSDHTFIDQDVTSGSSPTFDGANFTGIDAADVDIADVGAIITATTVEGALQENRTAIDLNTAKTGVPAVDETAIAYKTGDSSANMRIDVDAVTTATTRVLTMPDQDIDLTPGTGSFATAAEGDLAATAMQDLVDDTTPQLGANLDVNGFGLTRGANELLTFVNQASAVNHVAIGNATAGNGSYVTAAGDDTDIDLYVDGKGTGAVILSASNLDVTGNIIVSGTVDGRDLATDGTKLDAITGTNTGDEVQGTTTTAGIWESATVAEIDAGTSTTLVMAVDEFAGSDFGTKTLQIEPFDGGTAVTTGDGTKAVTIPASMDGFDLVNAIASVEDKGVTGTTDVVVRRWRGGAAADMLSAAITIGDEWFAQDGTIDTANDDVQTGDRIYVDVDAIHSGTAPNGLSVVLEFRKP